MPATGTAIDKAKATLLRALDELESAETDLGHEPERVDLIVTYEIGYACNDTGGWDSIGGWASTAGPAWLHAALLRRTADAREDAAYAADDELEND